MALLIVNCNHWIGFHVTNALLEEDFRLDGMIDSTIDNHLSMFFGRNSNFNFIDKLEKKYEACIIVGEYEHIKEIESDKKLLIQTDKGLNNIGEYTTIIRPPLLFGEWMPMNEKGFYQNQHFISFDSEEFRKNGLFIDLFTSLVLQWLKSSRLPNYLNVNPTDHHLQEQSIYVRENRSIEKHLDTLRQHYKRYRNFYQ